MPKPKIPGMIKGLGVTFGELVQTLKPGGGPVTVPYPHIKEEPTPRARGVIALHEENCTACMLCPTVCPAECIHIEAGERPDKEKYPVKFEIDILRCCYCGFCEEACPKDAIKLSNIYEMAVLKREDGIYDKEKLLVQRGDK